MKNILSGLAFLGAAMALSCTSAFADSNNSKENKGGSKILVAYYSDTRTTEAVAEKIAAYLGADLLKIESEVPYSSADLNYGNRSSRVCREHDEIFGGKGNGQATAEDMKKVDSKVASSSVVDLSGYDTVFVGYPIWWGMAAWPVNGFVTQNDLSGKTVVPFCTSVSSGLGKSDKVLRDVAGGTGNWLDGKRFGTRAGEQEVRSWVDSTGIKR